MLPQMLPHFPKDADKAVDLFCGGCNVGINLTCSKVKFNDSNVYLMGLLDAFRRIPKQEIFDRIFLMIDQYRLSLVCKNGYAYYGCESGTGLGAYNKEGYIMLIK